MSLILVVRWSYLRFFKCITPAYAALYKMQFISSQFIKNACTSPMDITDRVYGKVNIPHDIHEIMLTPQMQRLKKISQLGFVYSVFPKVKISRFDHCVGTYIAACKMLNSLNKKSQKELPSFILNSVKIAALLHDVGHGPFSHVWEYVYPDYHHEENGLAVVDAIFNCIPTDRFQDLRENNSYGIKLIKAIIVAKPERLFPPLEEQYGFVFEIVNNKQAGVDVDKWDYLKRDYVELRNICEPNMDFDDVFLKARISEDGKHIEYRYEDYHKIYALFEARYSFHVCCYRAPKVSACDSILKDILQQHDYKICGENVAKIDAHNMPLFLELTDEKIWELIVNDKMSEYLKDPKKLEQVMESPSSGDGKIIRVNPAIEGPGQMMPPDDCFFLYGDKSTKKVITRKMETIFNKEAFLLTLD